MRSPIGSEFTAASRIKLMELSPGYYTRAYLPIEKEIQKVRLTRESFMKWVNTTTYDPPQFWSDVKASPSRSAPVDSSPREAIERSSGQTSSLTVQKIKRGPRPEKFEAAKRAMRSDLEARRYSVDQFEGLREKELLRYGGGRTMLREARKAVIAEWPVVVNPNRDK